MNKNEFKIKDYLKTLKEQLSKKTEEEQFLEYKKLRTKLILDDMKKILILNEIEEIPDQINSTFSEEDLKELENIASELGISLDEAKAVVYIEMLLDMKKENLKKDKNEEDIEIIDIYEFILNGNYLYKMKKEVFVISIFELEKPLQVNIF